MSGVEDTQSFTPYTISWDKFESNFVKIEKMDLYRCNILVTFQTDDLRIFYLVLNLRN
jgi:hypothetical protein